MYLYYFLRHLLAFLPTKQEWHKQYSTIRKARSCCCKKICTWFLPDFFSANKIILHHQAHSFKLFICIELRTPHHHLRYGRRPRNFIIIIVIISIPSTTSPFSLIIPIAPTGPMRWSRPMTTTAPTWTVRSSRMTRSLPATTMTRRRPMALSALMRPLTATAVMTLNRTAHRLMTAAGGLLASRGLLASIARNSTASVIA
jgi:hypothetical protein